MVREDCRHLERHSRRFAVRAGVADWLKYQTWSRSTMAMVVFICTAFGILASDALRKGGLIAMGLRFPVAFVISYATFLLLVGLMVMRAARRLDAHRRQLVRDSQRHQSKSEDAARRDLDEVFGNVYESLRNGRDCNGDARNAAAYFLLLLAMTIVFICIYFICVAPTFLAELIVEGACLTGLYQPRDRTARNQWHIAALEQTALPALAMAACFMLIGISLQLAAPRAETIGDVLQQIAAQREVAHRIGERR